MERPKKSNSGEMELAREEKKDWRQIARDKEAEREARLPSKWLLSANAIPSDDVLDVTNLAAQQEWLSKQELAITNTSLVQLAQHIKERRNTAVEAVEAFERLLPTSSSIRKSPFLGTEPSDYSRLSEINFENARSQAQKLDQYLKDNNRVVGPLHGVPISVKARSSIGLANLKLITRTNSTSRDWIRLLGFALGEVISRKRTQL